MIKGNHSSGHGVTYTTDGVRIEQEFRQCSHCQASWVYQPGSGHKVGFCTYCMGLLCTRCAGLRWKQVDQRCLPYFDTYMENNSNKYTNDPVTGLFLRK